MYPGGHPGDKGAEKSEGDEGTEEEGIYLKDGEFFGEAALVKDVPRNACVYAHSDTLECFTVARREFTTLLGPLHDAMQHTLVVRTLSQVPLLAAVVPAKLHELGTFNRLFNVVNRLMNHLDGLGVRNTLSQHGPLVFHLSFLVSLYWFILILLLFPIPTINLFPLLLKRPSECTGATKPASLSYVKGSWGKSFSSSWRAVVTSSAGEIR